MPTEQDRLFDRWMSEVDRMFLRKHGVSVYDLPDMPFRDWHDDGILPEDVLDLAREWS